MEFKKDNTELRSFTVSMDDIISNVLSIRNQKVSELLNDINLYVFLENEYDIFGLSPVKKEFLKRDLIELQNSSLDLVHYSQLIKQLKEDNSASPGSDHLLFHQELRNVFDKYCL